MVFLFCFSLVVFFLRPKEEEYFRKTQTGAIKLREINEKKKGNTETEGDKRREEERKQKRERSREETEKR